MNLSIFGGVLPFQGRPGTSVPKSECKVRRFPRTGQIFRQVFSRKFQHAEGAATVVAGGQRIGRGEKSGQSRRPRAHSPPCGRTPNSMEGERGTALSFKIPSHYQEMCYFIARAVRMERAQPLIFKKISVLKIWSSGRFLVTLWVNIKQLR